MNGAMTIYRLCQADQFEQLEEGPVSGILFNTEKMGETCWMILRKPGLMWIWC